MQSEPCILFSPFRLEGAMLAQHGQSAAGIEQMRQGLATCRTTGAEILRLCYLALLAEAYRAGWQTEEGLALLAEALETVDKTGERFYEAELHQLKGELTLQSHTNHGQGAGKLQASRRQVKTSRKVASPKSPTPDLLIADSYLLIADSYLAFSAANVQ